MDQLRSAIAACCRDSKIESFLDSAGYCGLDPIRNHGTSGPQFAKDIAFFADVTLTEDQFDDLCRLYRLATGTGKAQLQRSRIVPPSLDLTRSENEEPFRVPNAREPARKTKIDSVPAWIGPGYSAKVSTKDSAAATTIAPAAVRGINSKLIDRPPRSGTLDPHGTSPSQRGGRRSRNIPRCRFHCEHGGEG